MEAIVRNQSLSTKENGKQTDDMDITYITDRIVVMLFLSSGKDAAYKSSFAEVSSQLRSKHGDHCLIVNLSEKRSDMHKWHKNVLDFGWPELLAPPLERLCNICKSVDSWLSSDPANVVVIHCKGGLGRVAVVIAAYIDYGKICASSDFASDQTALKRFYQQKLSNSPEPSQLRYVHYFVGLLSGAVKINNQPLYLHQIIISGVPEYEGKSDTCSLYFKIYQNMQPVYISQVYSADKSKSSHINVALSPSLQLRGDVIIKCFQQTSGVSAQDYQSSNSSLLFFCQFHTCAVTNNSLKFQRSDLDIACHNNTVHFPKDGLVEFNFTTEEGTQETTGYDLVGKSNVTSKNLLNVDELVRANSYENFNHFSSKESLLDADTLNRKSKAGGRMYGMDGAADGSIYSTKTASSHKESSYSSTLDYPGSSRHQQQQSYSSLKSGDRMRNEERTYNGKSEGFDGHYFPPLDESRKFGNYKDTISRELVRRDDHDQSQLDDILNELLTEQLNLSVDGRESRSTTEHYPDTHHVDRTLSTLPPQRGTITTEGDHSRSVLSWATSQAGPKHSVMVSKQTLSQPSPHHRIQTESSRYYESTSTRGRSHSSLGHSLTGPTDELLDMSAADDDMYLSRGRRAQEHMRVQGQRYPSGTDDIDWDELMRNSSTAPQTRRVEEKRTEEWRSSTQRGSSPPTPPVRRRIMSPDYTSRGAQDQSLLNSTSNRYRNYASDSEEPMSWLDKQRTKLHTKRSSTKPWSRENRTPDEQALVSELERVQTRRRAQSDTEDFLPDTRRYNNKRQTSSRHYETRTEYYTSGSTGQAKYKFNPSPSFSTSALNKTFSNSATPESTLRTGMNVRQNYEMSTTQRLASTAQKLQQPSFVEVEQEVISLQPIGAGVQNLEPGIESRTLSRSNTPAFPMTGNQYQQQQFSKMSNSVSVPSSLTQDEYRLESARTLGPRQAIPQSYTTLNFPQQRGTQQNLQQSYNTMEHVVTQSVDNRRVPMMPRSQSAMGGEIKYMAQHQQPFPHQQQQQQMVRHQGYSSTMVLPGGYPSTEGLEAIRVRQQQLLEQKQRLDEQERLLMIEQQQLQQRQQQHGWHQPSRSEIVTVRTETRTTDNNRQPFPVQQQHPFPFNQQQRHQQDSFRNQQIFSSDSHQFSHQQHGYSSSVNNQRSRADIERDIETIMVDSALNEARSGSPVYSAVKPANKLLEKSSGGESEIIVESANKYGVAPTNRSAGNERREVIEEEIIKPVSAAVCGARDTGIPPLNVVFGEKSSSNVRTGGTQGAASTMHSRSDSYEVRTNASQYGNNSLAQQGFNDSIQRGTGDQLMVDTHNLSSDSAQQHQFYTSTTKRGASSSGPYAQQLSPNFYRTYSRTGSMASGIDGFDTINATPRFVRDTSMYWHKPNISRDEAIALLKDKPAGSFVVRNSSTFQGAFGLAVKVDQLPPNVQPRSHGDMQTELVRHFLIEPTSKGVRLKGCSNEPTFGSLAALVYQHTLTPLALPCKLIIPEADELSLDVSDSMNLTSASSPGSMGAACNVLYLNSVDTESLTGPEALTRAIEKTFKPKAPSPKTAVVHFKVSNDGITLTDVKRRIFFRRYYPMDSVTHCGLDTKDQSFAVTLDDGSTFATGRIFGFVAHKPSSTLGIVDNSCHIFAELDRSQPASAIASFVTKLMTRSGTRTESFSSSSSSRVITTGTASRGILRSQ